MEILTFDVCGKLAHFRKYYANNTALSFSIPPRTTILGMMACVLGLPKETYHEDWQADKLRIGVRVLSPMKKTFHRLNLLRIVGMEDFSGKSGRIQTPFEVISGPDIKTDMVRYRIYLSCHPAGAAAFEKIKAAFLERKQVYALTLGTANFTAWLENVRLFAGGEIEQKEPNGFATIHSAVPSNMVTELRFDKEMEADQLEEDLLPGDFLANHHRELSSLNRTLFSTTPHGIEVKIKKGFYALNREQGPENILFLE